MRFAIKTPPQDTTWDALLAVWRAADDIEVFESGWISDHFHPVHGAGLAIVYLPPPHSPAVLEPLTSALSELR